MSETPTLTAGQIKHMVERFLSWKLPADFYPDGGIAFTRFYNNGTGTPARHEPSGTNLLGYAQAEAMVRHMLAGMPPGARGLTGEALREEMECTCGAGHGSGESHTDWCAFSPTPQKEGQSGFARSAPPVEAPSAPPPASLPRRVEEMIGDQDYTGGTDHSGQPFRKLTDSPAPIATPEEVAGISIDHYGENRTRLFFACPRRPGHRCSVLLKPWPIIGVPTWHWDGNEQAPTLTPSVNCVGGCGWHGFIQNGRLTNAG